MDETVEAVTGGNMQFSSLLFDAKTAGPSQDFDYIFQIASEGLEESIEIDSRFEKFSSTLFSEASIDFDRNVKTKDILDPVNRNLEAHELGCSLLPFGPHSQGNGVAR
ncbi:snoRNA-binding rRNA-processing protein utp10 [Candidozyma auris]